MAKLSILNGHLIDPKNNIDQQYDVFIDDGKILSIGEKPDTFVADHTIDATNLILCPGLIDLSVHSREPGQEHKATLASETAAAVSAGISTICIQPSTMPVIDTPAVAESVNDPLALRHLCRVLPMGAITQQLAGEHLSEIASLKDAGCVCLSDGGNYIENSRILHHALSYASSFEMKVVLSNLETQLHSDSVAHDGIIATRLGLSGSPEISETTAISRHLLIANSSHTEIHLSHISSAKGCNQIRRAQHDGNAVTADVAIHQLHLTDMDLEGFNSLCHVQPPLRTLADREALRKGVADGTIASICSDHQPHEADAKAAPFTQTASGISGLDTLLPLTLKLVDDDILSMSQAISCLTIGPAKTMGLDLGHLSVGATADICIFDPDSLFQVDTQNFVSQGKNSPFNNWMLRGRVTHTLVSGRLNYEYEK